MIALMSLATRAPGSRRERRTSLVYRSPLVYRMAMAALYGPYYRARSRSVAALVPPAVSVLELCCGPGTLFLDHLRAKGVRYRGFDRNPVFVDALRRHGVDAEVRDVAEPTPLPPADVVLIQASLYHFLPDAGAVVDRMRAAARDTVIVSEPVRNLATSRWRPVARIAGRSASLGDRGHPDRFTEATLDVLMAGYGDAVLESRMIPGGRDKVYVLRGAAEQDS
jgi:SAM-dependent methyltransferase